MADIDVMITDGDRDVLVAEIRRGDWDRHLELLLSELHERKKTRRFEPGFPRVR